MSASANKIAAAHRLLPMCASYVVVLMLGLPAAIALADSPPRLNVAPSCDAAARGAISAGRDKEACLVDERTAEGVLGRCARALGAAVRLDASPQVSGPRAFETLRPPPYPPPRAGEGRVGGG